MKNFFYLKTSKQDSIYARTAHGTTGHNPIQGSRLLQHSTNKTLQHLYRFQVIRGPQNSKKRTKKGPKFEQKGDPKGAQMKHD